MSFFSQYCKRAKSYVYVCVQVKILKQNTWMCLSVCACFANRIDFMKTILVWFVTGILPKIAVMWHTVNSCRNWTIRQYKTDSSSRVSCWVTFCELSLCLHVCELLNKWSIFIAKIWGKIFRLKQKMVGIECYKFIQSVLWYT